MKLSDHIWNRAAIQEQGIRRLPGDTALASLLHAHGYVMNGGISHAMKILTGEELNSAIAGYRFYGLSEVADLLLRARKRVDSDLWTSSIEDTLVSEYSKLIPNDSIIVEQFESHFISNPQAYAPV